ncbi:MAG: amino acid deaminase [Pseudomonadota bacterium]
MQLDMLLESLVDPTTKGWPSMEALPLRAVGEQGWNVLAGDLPLPVAVIKGSALSQNSRWMRRFIDHFGVAICPHGKTTMAPQLFARQLADGAWGITVATVQQLRVCRRHGVQRVIMANQLVGGHATRAVLAMLGADPTFWFACLVDSVELVEQMAAEVREFGAERPLQVLLEGGYEGGRAGCRTPEQALAVARAVAAAPELSLVGVEGFEGLIVRPTPAETAAEVEAFLASLVTIARACAEEGLFAPGKIMLSAGGSAFFDQVTAAFQEAGLDREVEVVLRSGCYLTHDSKMYREFFEQMRERRPEIDKMGNGLQAALELWAYVQSVPEPGLAIATLGKRDASFDVHMPVPEQWYRPGLHAEPQKLAAGFEVTGMNDQHAFVRMPQDSPLHVGDMLSFGISHPCTTFDRWQLLYVVDDGYGVVEGIRTFF